MCNIAVILASMDVPPICTTNEVLSNGHRIAEMMRYRRLSRESVSLEIETVKVHGNAV